MKKTTSHPPKSQWENVSGEAIGPGPSGRLGRRFPVERVPVLARPGMVVFGDFITGQYAVIVDVTPDFCIVEDEAGNREPRTWFELDLTHIEPDPAALRAKNYPPLAADDSTSEPLKLGEPCAIASGPLMGHEGIVERRIDDDTVEVKLAGGVTVALKDFYVERLYPGEAGRSFAAPSKP